MSSSDVIEAKLSHALLDLPEGINRRINCPRCEPTRKHKNERTLSIKRDGDEVLWNCWHCEETGRYKPKVEKLRSVETQPDHQPLTNTAVEWLNQRKISRKVATDMGLFSGKAWSRKLNREAECVCFPYHNQGQLYATKFRHLEVKDFSSAGAPQSFFAADMIGDLDRIIIVEGELDAVALTEAGLKNVIAVPNGAPSTAPRDVSDPEHDTKYRYIWNLREILEQVETVVLAGDADAQGTVLMEELARRIGKHKCWTVEWPEGCKDGGDTLQEHGADAVREAVALATRIPVVGLYEANAFVSDVNELYTEGKGSGQSTGYHAIDDIYTVVPGHLTVVTGNPSSGKSEFIDQLMVNLSERHKWAHAICSFENEPRYHIAKLLQKRIGKHFFPGPTGRMSEEEKTAGLSWVNDHFFFLHQADGSLSDIESIIDRLKVAVVRHGVRAAVIDPYNYIEQPNDTTETKWISDMLTKVRLFAQAHEIHIWFVAHPKKMNRMENGDTPVPLGYDISGSAAWFAKADFGVTVHRTVDDPSLVSIYCWKSRFSWAGRQGKAAIVYDPITTTYQDSSPDGVDLWDIKD